MCLFTALALKHSDVCYEIYLSVTYVQNIHQQHYLTVDCVQQIDALLQVQSPLLFVGLEVHVLHLACHPKTNTSKIS